MNLSDSDMVKNKNSNISLKIVQKKTPTILVVEDNVTNYLYLEAVLENDFKLAHAANGKEGVKLFKSNDIDLILMDMKMPIMSGIDATIEIRKINKEIPIIALTTYSMELDKEVAVKAGCNNFLSKPINRNKLLKTINDHL